MAQSTWKVHLTGWLLVLLTGGLFAGFLFLWRYVDTRRSLTVSPGVDARWAVPVTYVGESFDSLQACQEEPASGTSRAALVDLGAWHDDVVELAPAFLAGPPALSYETYDANVGSYWSLKPPDVTIKLKVRLVDAKEDAPSRVDLELHGCVKISAAYWEDQESDAAKTLNRAREDGDPAIVSRAEAFVDELAERKALLGGAHEVAGDARFEVQSASTLWASVLAAGYYVLAALTIVSALVFGYCLLALYLRLKADE